MIIYRCADRLSSDRRETPTGSGAAQQHATHGPAIKAMRRQRLATADGSYWPILLQKSDLTWR
jgi:hypothetical protein